MHFGTGKRRIRAVSSMLYIKRDTARRDEHDKRNTSVTISTTSATSLSRRGDIIIIIIIIIIINIDL